MLVGFRVSPPSILLPLLVLSFPLYQGISLPFFPSGRTPSSSVRPNSLSHESHAVNNAQLLLQNLLSGVGRPPLFLIVSANIPAFRLTESPLSSTRAYTSVGLTDWSPTRKDGPNRVPPCAFSLSPVAFFSKMLFLAL